MTADGFITFSAETYTTVISRFRLRQPAAYQHAYSPTDEPVAPADVNDTIAARQ